VDWAKHHLFLTLDPGVNQCGVGGVVQLQRSAGLGETSPGILLRVPGWSADGGQEMLHGVVVSMKKLAIEITGIPVDEYAAEIEDGDGAMGRHKTNSSWSLYAAVPILLAPLLGPFLAGAILKYAAWPWLFYINLPVGVLAVVLAIYLVPHDEAMIRKRPFDFAGFVTLSPGLTCLLYGFERASHHKGLSFLILGVILIGTFLLLARSKKEKALINIQLFRIRTFSVAATTQFLSSGIVYAGQFLVPLYLISGAGLSPARAGWVLSTMGIGMLCIYPLMGYLTDKFGCRTVAASGVLINFLGTLPFVWMACTRLSIPLSILGLLLRGMGQGATGIPSLAAAYASVPKEGLSLATTAINIVQRVGAPIMTTAIAIVVALSQAGRSGAEPQAFFIPFIALIVCQLFVLGSASRLPRRIH
jgi:MFS family permease